MVSRWTLALINLLLWASLPARPLWVPLSRRLPADDVTGQTVVITGCTVGFWLGVCYALVWLA